jgi:L-cysteine/cystine lyase
VTPEEARRHYPVLARTAYLNAGTCGPIAHATHEAMLAETAQAVTAGRAGKSYFDRYMSLSDSVRAGIAEVIGVPATNLALTTSTTEGCNIAIVAMEIGPGDEVVTTDNEHPGLSAPLEKSGADLRVAAVLGRPAAKALEAILELVTPRTKLIALSHVGWLNGQVFPVVDLKRQTGLPVLVDGAQSVGAIPVAAAEIDFYTVSGQKWLCGPEATGALYVREPERWRPRLGGYLASHGEGAQRYQMVHHANSSLAALEAALAVHPPWRYERAAEMAALARRLLSERFEVVSEEGQGTLVSFVPPGDPEACVARALEAGVVVRSVPGPGWVRVSTGYWTMPEDIERLVAALS